MPPKGRMRMSELAEFLAATVDAAFALDGEDRIVLWNGAAEDLLGYSAREAIGRRCCDLLLGDDGNGTRLCCRNEIGTTVRSFDMRARTRSGAPMWVHVSTVGLVCGEPGRWTVHVVRDIVGIRETLAELRERFTIPLSLEPGPSNGHAALTRRETEILHVLAAGFNTKEAAERLGVSPATVRNHVQNILGKLGAHSRLEAVAYATRQRLI